MTTNTDLYPGYSAMDDDDLLAAYERTKAQLDAAVATFADPSTPVHAAKAADKALAHAHEALVEIVEEMTSRSLDSPEVPALEKIRTGKA